MRIKLKKGFFQKKKQLYHLELCCRKVLCWFCSLFSYYTLSKSNNRCKGRRERSEDLVPPVLVLVPDLRQQMQPSRRITSALLQLHTSASGPSNIIDPKNVLLLPRPSHSGSSKSSELSFKLFVPSLRLCWFLLHVSWSWLQFFLFICVKCIK